MRSLIAVAWEKNTAWYDFLMLPELEQKHGRLRYVGPWQGINKRPMYLFESADHVMIKHDQVQRPRSSRPQGEHEDRQGQTPDPGIEAGGALGQDSSSVCDRGDELPQDPTGSV